jgi:acylphosphatase
VEAVLQGSPEALEKVMAWARRGPPGARVAAVTSQDAQGELERTYSGFEQLPTG